VGPENRCSNRSHREYGSECIPSALPKGRVEEERRGEERRGEQNRPAAHIGQAGIFLSISTNIFNIYSLHFNTL